ncbi:hypothetical protein [Synechocystis sp. PCC 7339]|uniref:hypothetical protein n=1 Tax=Synechocystis sp. PCC 7339 TaxID=2782213 RepID=UPI001CBFE8C0|nr:hypothetical protein [Synechocystis sp. PCC 7339]
MVPPWHQLKFFLAFVCASAIHGGLLWLPLPPEPSPPTSAESPPEAIATVPLADLVTPAPMAKSTQEPTPEPTPPPPPAPQAPAKSVTPKPPRSQPSPPKAPPKAVTPPQPAPPTPEPKPALEANETKAIEPEPIPALEARPIEPEPIPEPIRELMPGIPHLEGATSGCHGSDNCHFLEGATVRNVTQDLQARLEAQGFRLSEGYRDTGLRVYEVYRDDKPVQFLHIASDNAGRDTFYVLSPQQKTLEELRSP